MLNFESLQLTNVEYLSLFSVLCHQIQYFFSLTVGWTNKQFVTSCSGKLWLFFFLKDYPSLDGLNVKNKLGNENNG